METTLYISRKTPLGDLPSNSRVISLEVKGFSRNLDPANAKAFLRLAEAFFICRRDMKWCRPQAAVGFGGYACFPGAAAALSMGIPLVIHEQNVVPGLANRLLAPAAKKIAVSFEETLLRLPSWKNKALVTGNPLRKSFMLKGEENPWKHFGLDEMRKTLAVVGGSQGAASLNRAVAEALPMWREREDLQIVHSVGGDKYEEFISRVDERDAGGLIYRPLKFIDRMDLLYRAADLVVCRAGASTVAELAAMGCAAVLVPYPHATASHQEANAEVLKKAGAAMVLMDRELSGHRLKREVDELLGDPERLNDMRIASLRIGKPEAAGRLAELVLATT